jgi:hypothetical protein
MKTLTSILLATTLMFALGGCGGSGVAGGGVYTAPAFYAQVARAASAGGWAQLPTIDGVVTAPVGSSVRVFVDSGTINTLTVRNQATGKDEAYVAGTQVAWSVGTWIFKASVTKQDKTSDLVLTLTITPTLLTNFSVTVIAGGGYDPVSAVLDIQRVAEGQEVYFWVGGQSYPIGTKGGFGAIGDAIGEGTIQGTFYKNTATWREAANYVYVPMPFTKGGYMNHYNMYSPPPGDYIVTASFPFEGRVVSTPPHNFTVGPYSSE